MARLLHLICRYFIFKVFARYLSEIHNKCSRTRNTFIASNELSAMIVIPDAFCLKFGRTNMASLGEANQLPLRSNQLQLEWILVCAGAAHLIYAMIDVFQHIGRCVMPAIQVIYNINIGLWKNPKTPTHTQVPMVINCLSQADSGRVEQRKVQLHTRQLRTNYPTKLKF